MPQPPGATNARTTTTTSKAVGILQTYAHTSVCHLHHYPQFWSYIAEIKCIQTPPIRVRAGPGGRTLACLDWPSLENLHISAPRLNFKNPHGNFFSVNMRSQYAKFHFFSFKTEERVWGNKQTDDKYNDATKVKILTSPPTCFTPSRRIIFMCSKDSSDVDAWSTPSSESSHRSLWSLKITIIPTAAIPCWYFSYLWVKNCWHGWGFEPTTLDYGSPSGTFDLSATNLKQRCFFRIIN